jgi:hypothetical protein
LSEIFQQYQPYILSLCGTTELYSSDNKDPIHMKEPKDWINFITRSQKQTYRKHRQILDMFGITEAESKRVFEYFLESGTKAQLREGKAACRLILEKER